ncbi:MAG TPA: hypothetical protein VEK57_29060 [Thermoanaerobaculia bacterium]|nr:hypothetical protein [Thermoanaerobaculia bacterium]
MRITTVFLALALLSVPASADLVVPQTATNRILIPVAGNAAGANGTYFRSDIQLINFRNEPQNVSIWWYPQGSAGEAVPIRNLTISARSGITSEDFVLNILQQTGIGAIEIFGIESDGAGVDANAQLHATARIWTPQPNVAGGTMAQTFPAIEVTTSTVQTKWIFGVRRTEQYRLNVGVAHNSPSEQTFRITVVPTSGVSGPEVIDIVVPARSMQQISRPGPDVGTVQVIIQNISATASTTWQGWASSIDNVTGDAWSQMAFPAPASPAPVLY